jgi:crossover junction endodeoxyribonuclease RuvC
MIILGVDPGSRQTGFALIETQGQKLALRHSGTIQLVSSSNSFEERLLELFNQIEKICLEFNPAHLALESLIHVKNVSSLAKLAQARGVIIASAMRCGALVVQEYAPNLVKQMVAGHGHADKEMIQKAIGLILGIKNFKTHDESDAIAMAITHALMIKSRINNLNLNRKGYQSL